MLQALKNRSDKFPHVLRKSFLIVIAKNMKLLENIYVFVIVYVFIFLKKPLCYNI